MEFEQYLISKKIDGHAFKKAEPELYEAWKNEFTQMHPASFTMQNLNLINPVRRKYLLRPETGTAATPASAKEAAPSQPKPAIKPRPKFN